MNLKYERLNRFRRKRRMSVMAFARYMQQEGYEINWFVLRNTFNGSTIPRDYTRDILDSFISTHETEIRTALNE